MATRFFRLGAPRPKKNDAARRSAKENFKALWIVGTTGAFFTALPVGVKSFFGPEADLAGWLDRLNRVGYMVWLLAYFFVTQFWNQRTALGPERAEGAKDEVDGRDIAFDVVQSAVSLVALFFLGFLIPEKEFVFSPYPAALSANGAIAIICCFSLLLFPESRHGLNRLRVFGLIASAIPLFVGLLSKTCFRDAVDMTAFLKSNVPFLGLLLLQALLWLTWWQYLWITVDYSEPSFFGRRTKRAGTGAQR